VDVAVKITEGDQYRLGRIEFTGNKTTRDKVLRRELQVFEGDIMDMETFKKSILKVSQLGYFKKANTTPKRMLKELRCNDDFAAKFEVGSTMKLDEIFQPGQTVDARGTTRGRGFTGVMRRWSFAGGVGSHGTHEYFRHGGSIGTNMTPGRTLPNVKMPGQYGNETVSVLNLKVAKVDFAILGDRERDTGDTARRLGDEATFQTLAKRNVEMLAALDFKRIVTADPQVDRRANASGVHSSPRNYTGMIPPIPDLSNYP